MRNVHPIARMSKPTLNDEKARHFTSFILNCVKDTKETNDVYNALAMYNLASDVIDSVGNESVTNAATELQAEAHRRLETIAWQAVH